MKKILVVDDEPLMGASLQEALRKWKYDVNLISEGQVALSHLAQHEYDMVLTDVRMPHVSGMEILEKVMKASPATAVIMMTAYGTIDKAVEALKKGAYDYVTKPFPLEAIRLRIEKFFKDKELQEENRNLRLALQEKYSLDNFVGRNTRVLDLFKSLEIAFESDATVFIQSENGTGKELIASAIHYNSSRKGKPFIKLNCASIPENLIESQLFGHEKGAFTNAIRTHKGVFEEADGGTLLLDEVTEMPTHLQAKLLRVLQEGEFSRLGSNQVLRTDVRIVATSNCDVPQAIESGKFRQDLYFRLNVLAVHIPPLRDRKDDIPLLCDHFIKKYGQKYGKTLAGIDDPALQHFYGYHWPGNVRELENMIQRSVLSCSDGETINLNHITKQWTGNGNGKGQASAASFSSDMSIEKMEKHLILATLKRHNHHKTRTAEILGVTLKTLRSKLIQYGLEESTVEE
jgi:DNA-binding NtrC family response regulator